MWCGGVRLPDQLEGMGGSLQIPSEKNNLIYFDLSGSDW